MISLRQHDRVGRSRAPDPLGALPSIEERAAIARGWAASRQPPAGIGRTLRSATPPRALRHQIDGAVSAVVDPVLERMELEDCDIAGVRAFAERMLRGS